MKKFSRPLVALSFSLTAFLTSCQHASSPASTLSSSSPPPAFANGYAAVPPLSLSDTTYVFGWGALPTSVAKPRGGTTVGSSVTFAPPRDLPLAAIAAASDAFNRDRAAILALAGDYKVSFHFMEALGLTNEYQPTRPYHSWATEQVRILADTGRFISLQHTIVMFFKNEDGTASPPALVKHWRQDWAYEPSELHTFRGENTWARRRVSSSEAAGTWSQSVYQVDDSPRYAALGRWEHRGNLTTWTGENAWRPLPRREHTVRKDYDVMEGSHRIVITPTGWLHEQLNWKRVAGETVPANAPPRYVAEEWGLDRYERITAPSLVAADEYWEKTGGYWAIVRQTWNDEFARRNHFTIKPAVDGKALFEEHFGYADKLETGTPFDSTEAARQVRTTLENFLGPVAK